MRVLFVGDIYGKAGRRVASSVIPVLKKERALDFVIGNGENAAGGFGITLPILRKLERYGIDCITSGNHLWDKKDIIKNMDALPNLLRPANYPDSAPGIGAQIFKVRVNGPELDSGSSLQSGEKREAKIGVLNLAGRSFMPQVDCPFRTALKEIEKLTRPNIPPLAGQAERVGNTTVIIVDFHGESGFEKKAFALWLDGKVSAVLGSHTHVQTADEQILPRGTAYITDVGMTGSFDSVIGVIPEKSINYFIHGTPQRFDTAHRNEHLNGVILDIDELSGKASSIKRIKI